MDIAISDVDLEKIITLPLAIEATRKLSLEVIGTRHRFVKQIDLLARTEQSRLTMAFMLNDVIIDDAEPSFDYYMYGVYVDYGSHNSQ